MNYFDAKRDSSIVNAGDFSVLPALWANPNPKPALTPALVRFVSSSYLNKQGTLISKLLPLYYCS